MDLFLIVYAYLPNCPCTSLPFCRVVFLELEKTLNLKTICHYFNVGDFVSLQI